jgi:NADP-dependent 3-hydroxy acid dehydrogenase YdfG
MTDQLTALVTGASSGIGRATAIEFARRGYVVFASARREEVLTELANATPGIRPLAMDVTDEHSVEQAVANAIAETGAVDVLVNNAGFALAGPVEVLGGADVRRQFDTNVFGLLAVSRAVLPGMRARRSGRIVNVSSLVGRITFPGMGIYGATKHAVEALSDALRQEVAGFGIKVVVIEPGFVATGIGDADDARSGLDVPDAYAAMVAAGSEYLAKQTAKGIAPERVAAVIADAAERPSPRTRYVVPASSKALITLLSSLPDRISDGVKQRALAPAD